MRPSAYSRATLTLTYDNCTPVSPALGGVHNNFGFLHFFFTFESGVRAGQTGKTHDAANSEGCTVILQYAA